VLDAARSPDWSADLTLALGLADQADELTLSRFLAHDLVVRTKPDLTPVSDADTAVEQALRLTLASRRPEDAILGEEFGVAGTSQRRWILDPIDGTKNFVRGVRVWACLVALEVDDMVVVGVVSAPALGQRWWAARGLGAWTQTEGNAPRRLQVSAVDHVSDASLSFSELADPAWVTTGTGPGFQTLTNSAWRTRAYGDFWSHMLVAEGAVDIALEPELGKWDMAALVPIVEEAGGRVTSLTGSDPLSGGNALSTNGRLHQAVLSMLHGGPPSA